MRPIVFTTAPIVRRKFSQSDHGVSPLSLPRCWPVRYSLPGALVRKARAPGSSDATAPLGARGSGRMRALRAAIPLLAVLAAASCMVGPNYKTPPSDAAPKWLPSPGVAEKPLNAMDAYWWKVFQDPVLDGLVESAYRNNLSLQIAGARVLQARAQLNQSIGNLFPQQQGVQGAITYERSGAPVTV